MSYRQQALAGKRFSEICSLAAGTTRPTMMIRFSAHFPRDSLRPCVSATENKVATDDDLRTKLQSFTCGLLCPLEVAANIGKARGQIAECIVSSRSKMTTIQKVLAKTNGGSLSSLKVRKLMKAFDNLDERCYILIDKCLIVGGTLLLAILLECTNFSWIAEKVAPSASCASLAHEPSTENFLHWMLNSRLQQEK